MAEKKNEFDDINQLLSGMSDDLISPQPENSDASSDASQQVASGEPHSPPKSDNDQQIMDLLSGLDDSSSFGTGENYAPETPSMDAPYTPDMSAPEEVVPEIETPPPSAPITDIFDSMPGLEEPSTLTDADETSVPPETTEQFPEMPEIPSDGSEIPAAEMSEPSEPEPTEPAFEIEPSATDSSSDLKTDGVMMDEASALLAPMDDTDNNASNPLDGLNIPEEPQPIQESAQDQSHKPTDDLSGLDIGDLDLNIPESNENSSKNTMMPDLSGLPDLDTTDFKHEDIPPMSDTPQSPKATAEKSKEKKPFFASKPAEVKKNKEAPEKGLKLDDKQLNFIYKRIAHFGSQLRETTINVVQKEILPINDINTLLLMILNRKTVKSIKEFLEKRLKQKIDGPLLDPSYQKQLVDKEEAKHPRREKILRERTVRTRSVKSAHLEEFENNVLPILRPMIVIVAILTVLLLLIWPPVSSQMKINHGLRLISSFSKDNDTTKLDLAEQDFDKALKIRPKYDDAYLQYGKAYTSISAFQRALVKLTDYRSRVSENFKFNMAMGDLQLAQQQYPDALKYFRAAKTQQKRNFDAFDGEGQAHFLSGDLEAAKAVYDSYLKIDWKNVIAQYRLLHILIRQDDMPNVENKYELILHMKSKNLQPLVVTELGQYYIDKSKLEPRKRRNSKREDYLAKAYSALKRVNSKFGTYDAAFYQLARMRLERNDLFSAMKAVEKAIDLNGSHAEYYDLRGRINLKRGNERVGLAIQDFEKAVEKNPEYMPAHYSIANICFYSITNNLNAMTEYERVKELFPEAPEADKVNIDINEVNYNLGWLKYNLDQDYEGALEAWSSYRSSFPDNPATLIGSANAYYHLQRYKDAEKNYNAAIGFLSSIIAEKPYVNVRKPLMQITHKMMSDCYNNLAVTLYRLGNEEFALKNLWSAVETIKTIGFFHENENANVNLNLILHPTRNSGNKLIFNEEIPRKFDLPEE